jgi:hypothetical protein
MNLSRNSNEVRCVPNKQFRHLGAAAIAKAAYRYGFKNVQNGFISAPDGSRGRVVRSKTPGDASGAEEVRTADIAEDLECMVPVSFGSPAVKLHLALDTGSADLWCWSTHNANESVAKGRGTVYNPDKSKTAEHEKNLQWKIEYGDGSKATGDVYKDQVEIGGIKVKQQAVECARHCSSSFIQNVESDGVLGMAFKHINTVRDRNDSPAQVSTLLDNMVHQKQIEQALFTANLCRSGKDSFYTFGTIDKSVTSNEMRYTPVHNSRGRWEVQSNRLELNGAEIQFATVNSAVVDSGTTLLLLDDQTVEVIYGSIPGSKLCPNQGGYTFPADAQLPRISLYVGEHKLELHPETLKYGSPREDGHIFGAIQSAGDLGHAVFGDVFLKNAYVVFDQGKQRLGVAQKQ